MKKAIFHTSRGKMEAVLYEEEVPGIVEHFERLVGEGFYEGRIFFKHVPGILIQTGCPYDTGYGGIGYFVKCETHAARQYHDFGVLSFANTGKNTNGSQFFICLSRAETAQFDGAHTCFGRVTGLYAEDVLRKLRKGDHIDHIEIEEVADAGPDDEPQRFVISEEEED